MIQACARSRDVLQARELMFSNTECDLPLALLFDFVKSTMPGLSTCTFLFFFCGDGSDGSSSMGGGGGGGAAVARAGSW